MHEKILEKLTPIFQEVFEDKNLNVTDDLNADTVPNWDSVHHITLIVNIEDFTGIFFTADELANIENVGDIVSLLEIKGYTA